MAVITRASARLEADYRHLTPAAQAVIDNALEAADAAGTYDDYATAMKDIALAAGIQIPTSGDLAVCSCLNDAGGCGCGLIFDTALTGVVVTALADPGFNLSRLQCPTCGHDHGRPITD